MVLTNSVSQPVNEFVEQHEVTLSHQQVVNQLYFTF